MSPEQEAQSASTPAQNLGEAVDLSILLKQKFKPRNKVAEDEVNNAVETLIATALANSAIVKEDVLDTIEEMIAALDRKLTAQMNAILHAPEYQKLESAWRGLHYLIYNSETDATLKIRVLNVGKMELYRNLRMYPGARWDQIRCSRRCTNPSSASWAASPTAR